MAKARLAGWDRRGVRPACRACRTGSRRRRALQPALPRSHDRRCPSGSGWGEAPAASTLGCSMAGEAVLQRWRHPPSHGRPLTREHSVGVARKADGPSVLLAGRRSRRIGLARASFPKQLRRPARKGRHARKGVARKALPARAVHEGARPARGAREEPLDGITWTVRRRATFAAPAWDREIGGCARGLFWLQKSTSGAGSVPSGTGLAPTPQRTGGSHLPARFCLGRGAFASRKGVKRRRGLLAAAMSRGPWSVAACMRRHPLGYGRQRCRTEGQGSP